MPETRGSESSGIVRKPFFENPLFLSFRTPPFFNGIPFGDGPLLYKNRQKIKKNKWVEPCILRRKRLYFGICSMRIRCSISSSNFLVLKVFKDNPPGEKDYKNKNSDMLNSFHILL